MYEMCAYSYTLLGFESNIFFKTSHWLSKSASFELRIKHTSQYFILMWHNNAHSDGILFWNKQEKMYQIRIHCKWSLVRKDSLGCKRLFSGFRRTVSSWGPPWKLQFFIIYHLPNSRCRSMAGILPIRRKTNKTIM